MPALTPEQAQSLALSLRIYARTNSDFLHDHWDDLAPEERTQVHDDIFDLLLRADDVNALAGVLLLDSGQAAVDQINAAVANADQFMKKVADVKKAIGVVTAGLNLATAIAAKNTSAIFKGLQTLKDSLT